MAKINWGRQGRVYIASDVVVAASLVEVRRTKDITTTWEAKTATAEARDLDCDVNQQAGKTFQLEFEMLIEATDDGSDVQLLRDAFDAGTDLYVVVARNKKNVASGKAIAFKGQVFQFPDGMAQGEASSRSIVIKPSDPDNLPARVNTPLA